MRKFLILLLCLTSWAFFEGVAQAYNKPVSRPVSHPVSRPVYRAPTFRPRAYHRAPTHQAPRSTSHHEPRTSHGRPPHPGHHFVHHGPHYGMHGHFDGTTWVPDDSDPPYDDDEEVPGDDDAGGAVANLTGAFINRSGYNAQLQFSSQDRHWGWPDLNHSYNLYDHAVHNFNLTCQAGERICFGGWYTDGHGGVWGVGHDNATHCDHCCHVCGQGESFGTQFLNP